MEAMEARTLKMKVPLTETQEESEHGKWLREKILWPDSGARSTIVIQEIECKEVLDCHGRPIRHKAGFV